MVDIISASLHGVNIVNTFQTVILVTVKLDFRIFFRKLIKLGKGQNGQKQLKVEARSPQRFIKKYRIYRTRTSRMVSTTTYLVISTNQTKSIQVPRVPQRLSVG